MIMIKVEQEGEGQQTEVYEKQQRPVKTPRKIYMNYITD